MSPDDLTGPERSCEVDAAKRVRDQVFKRGGCGVCAHRNLEVQGFGRSVCGLIPSKEFPRCLRDPDGFALDRGVCK